MPPKQRAKRNRVLSPQSIFERDALVALCDELDVPREHVGTVLKAVVKKGITNFDDILYIPVKMKRALEERFVITTSKVIKEEESKHGRKLVVQLQDGEIIETVIIKHDSESPAAVLHAGTQRERLLVCDACFCTHTHTHTCDFTFFTHWYIQTHAHTLHHFVVYYNRSPQPPSTRRAPKILRNGDAATTRLCVCLRRSAARWRARSAPPVSDDDIIFVF
jgi:hypothetical protein